MEHLNALPSQLGLTHEQIMGELLPYHRIKRKSEHICDECIEEDGRKEKTCFICGREFIRGRVFGRKPETREENSPIMSSIMKSMTRQRLKEMTEEERQAMRDKYAETHKTKLIDESTAAKALEKLRKSQKEGRPLK